MTLFPVCPLCAQADDPPSSLVPAICRPCANAIAFGLRDRFAAIAEAERRARACRNCGGIHDIQHCAEVLDRLFAPACPDCGDPSSGGVCQACTEDALIDVL